MLRFNTNGMVTQYFPFPDPIMDYLYKNLQPQHLIKLYPCCKFFYAEYGQPIIQHLEIVDDGEPESFDFTKSVVCSSNPLLKEFADFWITDSLIDRTQTGSFASFTNCTIKKMELCGVIQLEDFDLLTKAGTIEMKIAGVSGENGHVSIDKIIAQVPNANSIEISETHFTATTCASLVSMNHKVKMPNLILKNVTPPEFCEHGLFIDFVVKISDDHCYVFIDFKMIPEVDYHSRDLNADMSEMGNAICKLIAKELKAKEMRKKEVAALKNKGNGQSCRDFARSRTIYIDR